MIGRLKRVPLREVWKHEASDFTRWLEENTDVLNELLDLQLSNVEREKDAGDFFIDLVAEDDCGNPVIIENQLERSNHDHLGKVVTYLSSMGAKIAIWIVADARPEHIKAVSWLNESLAASVYLLKVEAVQIDESPPAPLLTLLVGPSEEGRAIGAKKKEMSETCQTQKRFWDGFLAYAKTKTKLHAHISPTEHHWIGTSAGINGLGFNYAIKQHETQVELYIDRGKGFDEENLSIFRQLLASKSDIERAFGGPLEWQELEDRRACRIRNVITVGGYRDSEQTWPAIFEAMVDAMIRLERALAPQIKAVRL